MILNVCAKLHNLCIDDAIDIDHVGTQPDALDFGDTAEVHTINEPNIERDDDENFVATRIVEESERRDNIVDMLCKNGWVRPDWAKCNSHAFNKCIR